MRKKLVIALVAFGLAWLVSIRPPWPAPTASA